MSTNLLANNNPVTHLQAFAYASPVAGCYFFYVPMFGILPALYIQYFGIGLAAMGMATLLLRVFDAVCDPSIGYLADRHRAQGGRRQSWVIAGTVGATIAGFYLFNPVASVSLSYYFAASVLFFLCFTMAEVPGQAWGGELTPDYNQRARVYGARNIMMNAGVLAFYLLPLMPFYPGNSYTPVVLADAFYWGAAIAIAGLLFVTKHSPVSNNSPLQQSQLPAESPLQFIQSHYHNRPLLIFSGAYAFIGISLGMWFGLMYFYIDSYLKLGEQLFIMLAVGVFMGFIAGPFWPWLVARTNKKTAWLIGESLLSLQFLATWLVGPDASWWFYLVFVSLAYLSFSCSNVAMLAVLADIVDYGKLKFSRDRGASYFAFGGLIYKTGLGIGAGLSLMIAGFYGFDPAATDFNADALFGLKLGFIYIPLVCSLLAMAFTLSMPINRQRYQIIQRRLAQRAARQQSRIALAGGVVADEPLIENT